MDTAIALYSVTMVADGMAMVADGMAKVRLSLTKNGGIRFGRVGRVFFSFGISNR